MMSAEADVAVSRVRVRAVALVLGRGYIADSNAPISEWRCGTTMSDDGGESGIRTHGRVSPTHAFQACSFNHSDISPCLYQIVYGLVAEPGNPNCVRPPNVLRSLTAMIQLVMAGAGAAQPPGSSIERDRAR